ncbi:MAG: hypothetical protein WCB27_17905 [Thermoguttaceae bacterium]
MGLTKQKYIEDMERVEENRDVAEEIMVRAGLLARCASCGEAVSEILHAQSDLKPAYRIASAMFSDGDQLVEGHDRRAVLDTIKAIAADCASDCQCMRRGKD